MAPVSRVSPRARAAIGAVGGAVMLIATIATVGTGAFLKGFSALSPMTIGLAVIFAAIATAAAAWRWRTVASGLGLALPFFTAVVAYYRSQFLNTVLPGGVLGDVHRAYRHGRSAGPLAIAVRAVAMERIAGQAVQLTLVVIVLVVLGVTSPLRAVAWVIGGAATVVALAIAITALTTRGRAILRREALSLRSVFVSVPRTLQIVSASIVVVASHAATFVVACVATGVRATPRELLAVALVALLAGSIPVSLGGWGPREAGTAAAFAVLGLGASAGLASSTAFGVLAMIALLPGAAVVIADCVRPTPALAVQPALAIKPERAIQKETTA
jgi:uncharacterized membrane protein YbhN (UPF0104 family)